MALRQRIFRQRLAPYHKRDWRKWRRRCRKRSKVPGKSERTTGRTASNPFGSDPGRSRGTLLPTVLPSRLARMCIAAGDEFPSALAAVVDWLLPVEHPHYIVDRLHESGLCARFPDVALRLLNAILDDQPWAPEELGQCLEAIAQAAPALRQDPRHQRLVEFGRRRGN